MKFRFVQFGEIAELDKRHPIIFENFGQARGRKLGDNPYIDDEFPYLFYLHEGKRLTCYFYSFPDRLYYQDKTFAWAWNGDLFTEPEFRGKGLATDLVAQQVAVQHARGLGWGGVFATEAAIRVYQKLNFSLPGYADRYLYLRSLTPMLREHLGSKTLVSATDGLYQVGRFLVEPILRLAGPKAGAIAEEADPASEDCRNALAQLYYPEMFHFDGGADMLLWKLAARGGNRFYLLKDRATQERLSYLVVRSRKLIEPMAGRYRDFELMTLMDYGLFVHDDRPYDAIITVLFDLFHQSTADVLDIVSSSPELGRRARRRGMWRFGKGMSYKFCVPPAWTLTDDRLTIRNWRLSHFSGDAFTFE